MIEYKILNTTNEEDVPLLSKLNKWKGYRRQDPPCSELQELWPWHPVYQHSKMHPHWDYWCLPRQMEKKYCKTRYKSILSSFKFLGQFFCNILKPDNEIGKWLFLTIFLLSIISATRWLRHWTIWKVRNNIKFFMESICFPLFFQM